MTIVKKVKTVVRSIGDTFICCVFGSLRCMVGWGVFYAIDQTTGHHVFGLGVIVFVVIATFCSVWECFFVLIDDV